jgi:excisionase family DNA binding protein
MVEQVKKNRYLSPHHVARRLNVSISHVYTLIFEKKISCINIGTGRHRARYRILESEINHFIESSQFDPDK